MTTPCNKRRSSCPISFSLDVLGDKWTLLVMRDLIFMRKRRFGDFLNSAEKIATNILTQRLRNLEHAEIVTRRTDPENARQVLYELTAKGLDLIPVLLDLIIWGARYDLETGAPQEFLTRAQTDRKGLIEELRNSILEQSSNE
ncbi:winged helix-turn-helix transcriptional regulator [Sedimenticola sp.]|uniref:winged helix-turn-helix transcriptional regulator n=1 Tax=Sedimenticola sp. TaxID=1940285 RepID=UPI003D140B81